MNQVRHALIHACSCIAGVSLPRKGGALLAMFVWMAGHLCGQSSWPSYPNNGAISVTSGGNVGIGTTAPATPLHVFSTSASGGVAEMLRVGSPDGGGGFWDNEVRLHIHGAGDNGSSRATLKLGVSTNGTEYAGKLSLTAWNTSDIGTNGLTHALQMFTVQSWPLQLGTNNTAWMTVQTNGNVGIGTTSPQYKLAVNGTIGAQDVTVTGTGWADYVFRPGYRLRSLSEVRDFIQANGHLPDIPAEAEVKAKGVSLGDMQTKLLAKVEELTLHVIEQEKQNRELRESLTKENRALRERLARLEGDSSKVTSAATK